MRIRKDLVLPALAILLVAMGAILLNLDTLQRSLSELYNWCIGSFGWVFITVNICCLVFSLWIMFGRYRNVTLGGEGCRPRFGTLSWAGMMFTTSCGAWLIVYGFLEPLYCVSQTAVASASASGAYELGQMYAHFHWGPNAWCIYVPATVAIGYALYNRGAAAANLGEGIRAVTGQRWGRAARGAVNVVAICGAVVAPVISIGTGMPLLVQLVQELFGLGPETTLAVQVGVLLVWVAIFGTSVYLGLQKGIQRLSNLNVRLAFALMAVFGVLAGLVQVFSSEVNSVGLLAQNIVRLSTFTDPYGDGSFVKGWTFGYWACYFVFMPLVGVFTATISKGRKLKEIALGLLVMCSLGCWVAMATFGNYAIDLDRSGAVDVGAYLASGDEAGAVMAVLGQTPMPKLGMAVLLVVMFIFLATTMDSSAYSAAEMSVARLDADGGASTPRWLRMLWAVVAAAIAFALVQVGGAQAVRSLCYTAGLPLALITLAVMASVARMLREDAGVVRKGREPDRRAE